MRIRFRTPHLRQCFEQATVAYRTWSKPVGDRYVQRVRYILDAPSLEDLYAIRSLRLHPLTADREGTLALTLIDRWRLIISIDGGTVEIEEVTNHYGD